MEIASQMSLSTCTTQVNPAFVTAHSRLNAAGNASSFPRAPTPTPTPTPTPFWPILYTSSCTPKISQHSFYHTPCQPSSRPPPRPNPSPSRCCRPSCSSPAMSL
ncbi:hypothetical protein I7I50_06708 [Histoplasma capsulatum G186AR]|uniref:Uncharacterized protein n=1 Tax=Ajellomyces capsulatus TaxID=5037 RepID=A0A8H8D3S2_AJECA|nr:hypothetical protein I7I52_10218 [Histoplasma capsulatum]QSS67581.1 hypothetical protein I7I50_06708 [Histoplasma capsulatum G186AR]